MMVSKRNLSFFPSAHFQVNHGNNLQVEYDYNNIFFKWYQLWTGLYIYILTSTVGTGYLSTPQCLHANDMAAIGQMFLQIRPEAVATVALASSQPTTWIYQMEHEKTPKNEIHKVEMRMNKHERENWNGSIYIYISIFWMFFYYTMTPSQGVRNLSTLFGIQAWEHSLASTELD